MHQIQVERELDHPASTVWALLDDFASTWVYHPIVEHSASTNGVQRGLGAERMCQMYDGAEVRERVVRHDATRMTYGIEVFDHGPFPLTHMEVDITVTPLGAHRCRVTYDGQFQVKFGPMGWMMGKMMMEAQFVKMLGQVIDGAGQHLSTGRIVEQGGTMGALRGAA